MDEPGGVTLRSYQKGIGHSSSQTQPFLGCYRKDTCFTGGMEEVREEGKQSACLKCCLEQLVDFLETTNSGAEEEVKGSY